ncbi:MAG TPA: hypothetical protein VMQ67_08150 [Candidatus Saccharimonadales bacterium]|jgi:hypothetical protein|nr:hypothetical protein [Candidatus Saccharimonadales bacterium]
MKSLENTVVTVIYSVFFYLTYYSFAGGCSPRGDFTRHGRF